MRFSDRTISLLHSSCAAIPYVCALLVAIIVTRHGVPALRQDWAWPINAQSLNDFMFRSTSGWDVRGIGAPNLYLNDYLVGTALYLISKVIGTSLSLFAFAFGSALACALGASRLAGTLGAGPVARAGLALVATFNPFTYTETVAGHMYMVLAYGAIICLLAEARRREFHPASAALLTCLTLSQLQFFIPALLIDLALAMRRKQWLPFATAIAIAAPIGLSLIAEYSAFRVVPQTLAWEEAQSVPPYAAAILTGYFAGYDQSIARVVFWPMWAIVIIATLGCAVMWREPWAKLAAVLGLTSLVFATGLLGPLGSSQAWTFAHFPATMLYRELYDVLGFTAISYIVLVALATVRNGALGGVALIAGIALAAAWLVHSPWQWWVPARSIPELRVNLPRATRYALIPAFQPLVFRGRGSGLDPDAYARLGSTPLNTQLPTYPVDASLARFARTGDSRSLAALGAVAIFARPWLASDSAALKYQRALSTAYTASMPLQGARLNAQPLVTLLPIPRLGSVDDVLGAGAVFFADAVQVRGVGVPAAWHEYRTLISVTPSNRFVSAQDGWVDARLSFASIPQVAQAFGGAVTTSPSDMLNIDARAQALVWVRGALVSQDGRLVSKTTGSYHWVVIPAGVTALRCIGLCAVATQGFPPAGVPSTPRAADGTAVSFLDRLPWLIEVSVTAGRPGAVRLNEAYDRNWIALMDGRVLPHMRIDATVNGWLLPQRTTSTTIWLLDQAAAAEAVLELFGALWVVGLAIMALRRKRT